MPKDKRLYIILNRLIKNEVQMDRNIIMNRWKSLLVVACLTSSLFATQVFAVPPVSDLRDDNAKAQKEME